jgi:hypothetical protein
LATESRRGCEGVGSLFRLSSLQMEIDLAEKDARPRLPQTPHDFSQLRLPEVS